ncbi:MAG: hypothetical protein ABI128_03750 [Rhodanobacter sp.]
MQIQSGSMTFGALSGFGPQIGSATLNFATPVTQAAAFLTGFVAEFSNGDDHNLGQLDVQVSVPPGGISGSAVTVQVTYGLRDWSGSWDDRYDGDVYYAIVAE